MVLNQYIFRWVLIGWSRGVCELDLEKIHLIKIGTK
jgi:hypothetical protein